jgi:hypothetical protein
MDLETARAAQIAEPVVINNDGEEYALREQHPAGVLFSIFGRFLILLRAASRWGGKTGQRLILRYWQSLLAPVSESTHTQFPK